MFKIIWEDGAKEDFAFWIKGDKLIVKRIELLVEAIACNPELGIGKPEQLKYKFSGYWSRRINIQHRLIYKILEDTKEIRILACKGHYTK
jgi:toxin YoeB